MDGENRSASAIGEKLRQERVRRALDLPAVASSLSISERFLSAIETGRLDHIPGGFFARSFVRQYATFLGIYDEQLESALREIVVIEDNMPQRPAEQSKYATRETVRSLAKESRLPRFALIALACLVVAVAASSLFYVRWDRSRREASPDTPRPTESPMSGEVRQKPAAVPPAQVGTVPSAAVPSPPAPIPNPQTEPATPTSISPAPATVVSPAEVSQPVTVSAGVVLQLVATEVVWVSATVDGARSFQGTLSAGESRTIQAGEKARLVIGNAGALNIQWNGRAVGPIGPRGAVKILEFTPDAFDFVGKPRTGRPRGTIFPEAPAPRPSVEG